MKQTTLSFLCSCKLSLKHVLAMQALNCFICPFLLTADWVMEVTSRPQSRCLQLRNTPTIQQYLAGTAVRCPLSRTWQTMPTSSHTGIRTTLVIISNSIKRSNNTFTDTSLIRTGGHQRRSARTWQTMMCRTSRNTGIRTTLVIISNSINRSNNIFTDRVIRLVAIRTGGHQRRSSRTGFAAAVVVRMYRPTSLCLHINWGVNIGTFVQELIRTCWGHALFLHNK